MVPIFTIQRGIAKGRGIRAVSVRESGHAVVEAAMMAPWIFIFFFAVFDLGFYSYAVIATANAARGGVMYTSRERAIADFTPMACSIALRELRGMPNVPSTLSSCPAPGSVTAGQPVGVVAEYFDGTGTGASATADGRPASRVTVTYRSPQLFPLPGLMGQLQVTRIAEARLRDR